MNETIEKYLVAIAAAVDSKDKKAIELLDSFATYVYHDLYARANNSSGEEQVVWNDMLVRVKTLMTRIAEASPQFFIYDTKHC
jgi:hypothetical protein